LHSAESKLELQKTEGVLQRRHTLRQKQRERRMNMSWKQLSGLGASLGTVTLLLGTVVSAQAATPSAKTTDESQKAAQLLRDIKADAMQVQSAASRLDGLTKTSGATWLEYDRQWNEIKPAQEDMEMKMWRLERMQANISPAERQKLDQAKPMIGEIQLRTHELRTLLDQPGVQTSNVKFKTYARGLRNNASKLERSASAS
jgi:hypothetical protein